MHPKSRFTKNYDWYKFLSHCRRGELTEEDLEYIKNKIGNLVDKHGHELLRKFSYCTNHLMIQNILYSGNESKTLQSRLDNNPRLRDKVDKVKKFNQPITQIISHYNEDTLSLLEKTQFIVTEVKQIKPYDLIEKSLINAETNIKRVFCIAIDQLVEEEYVKNCHINGLEIVPTTIINRLNEDSVEHNNLYKILNQLVAKQNSVQKVIPIQEGQIITIVSHKCSNKYLTSGMRAKITKIHINHQNSSPNLISVIPIENDSSKISAEVDLKPTLFKFKINIEDIKKCGLIKNFKKKDQSSVYIYRSQFAFYTSKAKTVLSVMGLTMSHEEVLVFDNTMGIQETEGYTALGRKGDPGRVLITHPPETLDDLKNLFYPDFMAKYWDDFIIETVEKMNSSIIDGSNITFDYKHTKFCKNNDNNGEELSYQIHKNNKIFFETYINK
jgi:hypothetical protein